MSRIAVALLLVLAGGPAFAQCVPQICYLEDNYNPDPNANPYTPPSCDQAITPSQGVQNLIMSAIRRAPQRVQADFCTIRTIFANASMSVGVMEEPVTQGTNNYIFLDGKVVNGGRGTPLADVEDALQNRVLDVYRNSVDLTHTVPNDSPELGILAVLAHEMAHVNWFTKEIREQPCFQSKFIGTSWTRREPLQLWIDFAEDTGNRHRGQDYHPRQGNQLTPGKVKQLHRRFASVLGAVSGVEDYVEMYKVWALAGNLTGLTVTINPSNQSEDIVANLRSEPILRDKLACVQSF